MTDMIDCTTGADDAPDLGTELGRQINALAIKAAVARRNKERAIAAELAATAAVVAAYGAEGRKQAVDPSGSGRTISQVTVWKASHKATVTDTPAVEKWVRDKYPEKVQKRTRIVPGQEEAVILALRQYAGFLLEEYEHIPDYVLSGLLAKSEQARKPMGWGGEIDEDAPPGIKVDPRALGVTITYRDADLIDDLIEQGVIDHEGNVLVQPAVAPAPSAVTSAPGVDLAVDFASPVDSPVDSPTEAVSGNTTTAGCAA